MNRDMYDKTTGEFVGYDNFCRTYQQEEIFRHFQSPPPPEPKIAQDPRPEDALGVKHFLEEGKSCLVPTFMAEKVSVWLASYSIQPKIELAEDKGWSRFAPV